MNYARLPACENVSHDTRGKEIFKSCKKKLWQTDWSTKIDGNLYLFRRGGGPPWNRNHKRRDGERNRIQNLISDWNVIVGSAGMCVYLLVPTTRRVDEMDVQIPGHVCPGYNFCINIFAGDVVNDCGQTSE